MSVRGSIAERAVMGGISAQGIAFERTVFGSRGDGAATLARAILQHLPEAARRVLDLGCGTGGLAIELARQKSDLHLLGVDISEENVRRAAALAREAGLDGRVEVACADFACFDGGLFDAIVSDSVLYLIEMSDAALARKIAASLAPGGMLISTLPYRCTGNRLRLLLRRVWSHMPGWFDRGALAMARRLYPRIPVEILEDRLPYLRFVPPRLHGPGFAGALEAAGLHRVAETAWPSDSIAKLRHRLIVWRRL